MACLQFDMAQQAHELSDNFNHDVVAPVCNTHVNTCRRHQCPADLSARDPGADDNRAVVDNRQRNEEKIICSHGIY